MDFFRPEEWLHILTTYPWFVPLLGGPLAGTGFTQLIKRTYLDLTPGLVTTKRYTASVRLLAVISTFVFTRWLWPFFVPHPQSGLGFLVALISGVIAPSSYTATKALIAWKWPDFAKRLGDESDH
ncbi:MAG: hypothetical protein JSS29_15760 [Proteobacteria bacterium]|nr:hypothetical protein [Pseudomonadota bacterium]